VYRNRIQTNTAQANGRVGIQQGKGKKKKKSQEQQKCQIGQKKRRTHCSLTMMHREKARSKREWTKVGAASRGIENIVELNEKKEPGRAQGNDVRRGISWLEKVTGHRD